MKKTLGSLFFISMLFISSCGKKDASGCMPATVASEKSQMVAYCNANNIKYTEHSSGLLYEIITPGSGISPTISSTVSVVYTGKHFDNTVFDASATTYTNLLSNLIDGWKIGLPLIKKGGRIKLVIPSALAYSCTGSKDRNGNVVIQSNEPIFFDVTLSDVK